MAGIDYEAEYNNRARVPENPALIAGWASDAAAWREEHPPRKIDCKARRGNKGGCEEESKEP